ncbi:MAG: putative periplasmic lipoprotein [Ignavibacteriaceae bacterium]
MKKLSILFFTLVFITGCSGPIKNDLAEYTRVIQPLTKMEESVINRWNSVSGKSYVNDNYMYQALDDYIIDTYSQFVNGLKKIKPQTNEVKSLNEIYIQATEKQLQGYKMMKDGLEKRNKDIMNNDYKLLTDGRTEENIWANQLESLLKKH